MANLQIGVLGETFTINASEDEAYLNRILGYYKKIIDKIIDNGGLKDKLKISILAGVMLCDELYKEKSKAARAEENPENQQPAENLFDSEENEEAERLTRSIIEKLDKALL